MKYKGSIKKRLVLIIVSVTLLTGLIGYSSFVYWYMNHQREHTVEQANTVALILGQDFAKLVLLNEVSVAADISSSLKSFPNLNSMVLYTLEKKPILQYSKNNKSFIAEDLPKIKESYIDGNILKLYIDAKYQNTNLGYVQLKFKIDTLSEILKRNFFILLMIIISMLILSYILAIFFAKRFTGPILNLVKFLEKVEHSDSLNSRIITNEQNEYGKLYDEINRMLERIESSHEVLKLAAVTFKTQNGITITDKNENILQVNKAFTTITGYKAEEVIGKKPSLLSSGEHDKEFYEDMKESLKQRHFWVGEIINRHKDGSLVNEHLTIHAVLDDNNEISYYVASFLDITLQKETEAKLREKENLLVQKSKMATMGEMLENIAHQWRQPLSVISTTASSILIKKDFDMPISKTEEVNLLNQITDTVKYLSQTIDDFREFFKVDKNIKTFSLEECYRKVLNLLKPKFVSLNIEIIENINNVSIDSLENELIQVIMNILNNARDALIESENEKKLIFIEIYKDEENAIITIKDNAGGIPDEILEKIFEPYFTTKEHMDGTGIGLNMSKEMIEKHMNGTITVKNDIYTFKNKEYKGALFEISLSIKN